MSRYQRQKEKYWGKPVPPRVKHGPTSHARKVYGCRCAICTPRGEEEGTHRTTGEPDRPMTHDERQKRLRARKRGTPVPPGTKHGIYTSRVYRCKCDICRAAKSAQYRRKVDRWRETARGRWTSDGIMDTICWPPRDAGPEWTCPGCASTPTHQNKEVA